MLFLSIKILDALSINQNPTIDATTTVVPPQPFAYPYASPSRMGIHMVVPCMDRMVLLFNMVLLLYLMFLPHLVLVLLFILI
jgi:hypothetical protein